VAERKGPTSWLESIRQMERQGRFLSNLFWTQLKPKGKAEDLAKSKKADRRSLRTASAITRCYLFEPCCRPTLLLTFLAVKKKGGSSILGGKTARKIVVAPRFFSCEGLSSREVLSFLVAFRVLFLVFLLQGKLLLRLE
jgi:hypothetical protein